MQKILSRGQIRQADDYTIKNEPISSTDLMERAATAFVEKYCKLYGKSELVNIFCGKGNNGGDGLVAARLLSERKYIVKTFIVHYTENASEDFTVNLERLNKIENSDITDIRSAEDLPDIPANSIVIDALWGTGLTRTVKGFAKDIIKGINESPAKVVALDIASGCFCDDLNTDDSIINADHTLSFQVPKFCFLMPEYERNTGIWKVIDIGLDNEFIEQLDSPYYILQENDVKSILKKYSRKRFAHKGHFGHALIMSGSYGKLGAALLGAKSALRTGAGLVSAYIPGCGYEIFQTAVPEVMVLADMNEDELSDIPDLTPFNSIGTGPGLGTGKMATKFLARLLNNYNSPLLMDADAINILALNPELKAKIPEKSILTPHIGEFDRIAGKSSSQFERLKKLKEFSEKHSCIMVLKGAYTAVCLPDRSIFFNSTGNPGMATGGSGDVLTGILTGLLAQNFSSEDAAISGVYLHGMAGDIAAKKYSQKGLIASDLIKCLPKSFKKLA